MIEHVYTVITVLRQSAILHIPHLSCRIRLDPGEAVAFLAYKYLHRLKPIVEVKGPEGAGSGGRQIIFTFWTDKITEDMLRSSEGVIDTSWWPGDGAMHDYEARKRNSQKAAQKTLCGTLKDLADPKLDLALSGHRKSACWHEGYCGDMDNMWFLERAALPGFGCRMYRSNIVVAVAKLSSEHRHGHKAPSTPMHPSACSRTPFSQRSFNEDRTKRIRAALSGISPPLETACVCSYCSLGSF